MATVASQKLALKMKSVIEKKRKAAAAGAEKAEKKKKRSDF